MNRTLCLKWCGTFVVCRENSCIARWDTGNNLPDLSVIVELADFYDVDLNEIFRGERRKETMDTELKDTLLQAAEYSEGIRKNNQKNGCY